MSAVGCGATQTVGADDDLPEMSASSESGESPECEGQGPSADCTDPAAPFCSAGQCVDCRDAVASACGQLDGDAPVCDGQAGVCVQCTEDDASACPAEAPVCGEENLCKDMCDDLTGRWEAGRDGVWLEIVQMEDEADGSNACWLEGAAQQIVGETNVGELDSMCRLMQPDEEGLLQIMGWASGGYTKYEATLAAPCTTMELSVGGYGGSLPYRATRVP